MIPYICQESDEASIALAQTFGLTLTQILPKNGHYLCWQEGRLSLHQGNSTVAADFTCGEMLHRHQYGGGLGQPVAKAVGVKKNYLPHVLDVTAGLGRDAFILASLGCQLTLLERSPIAAALLSNGLTRAQNRFPAIINRMQLYYVDSLKFLQETTLQPEVVYIDPMFPTPRKNALSKKEMQAFQQLIGSDSDSALLLTLAQNIATRRIVVKRASTAPWLAEQKPHYSLTGKSTRFDIYLPKI